MVALQDLIDSPLAHAATAGLLPAAARAHSASRMLRGMATVGGEAVHGPTTPRWWPRCSP
jgi:CO/xanthine dehydrogenase FAD-binding subunit